MIKAEVGSLFFVSLGKKIHNNPSAYCNSGDLKEHQTNAALLLALYSDRDGHFSANLGSFPVGCFTLCFLAA